MPDPTPSAVPITIAVTGHRDPADPDAVARALDEVLGAIAARFPNTPLQALSPLAQGSDRLFAQAALDRGLPLDVVLPLPQATYAHDFPESCDEFRTLLARARDVAVLPYVPGVDPNAAAIAGLDRDVQYAQVGLHVARHAQILIALWDGQPARGLGGTGQIVHVRIHGRTQLEKQHPGVALLSQINADSSPLDRPDVGVVCWIRIRRAQQSPTQGESAVLPPQWAIDGSGKWHATLPEGKSARDSALAHLHALDEYNHAVAKHLHTDATARPFDTPGAAAELGHNSALVARLHSQHLAADALATASMQDVRRQFRTIFFLAAGMTAAFEIWAHLWPSWSMLALYVALIALIGWRIHRLRRTEAHERAVDWRVLAEGLRVQTFWAASGLNDLVSRHYMRRHGPALQWVRTALSGVLPVPPEPTQAAGAVVLDHWVEAQRAYYTRRVARFGTLLRRLLGISRGLYGLAIAAAVLVLLALIPGIELFTSEDLHHHAWIIVALGLLPAWSGLLAGYAEFAGYKDQSREYRRLGELFHAAAQIATPIIPQVPEDLSARQTFQRVVLDLGIEALREQADWALLHKSHEIEIPKG